MSQTAPYQDSNRPIDERIEDLLGRMTLEEKAGMMFHTLVMIPPDGAFNPDAGAFGLASLSAMLDKHMTHFNLVGSAGAEETRGLGQSIAGARRLKTARHSHHLIVRPAPQLQRQSRCPHGNDSVLTVARATRLRCHR